MAGAYSRCESCGWRRPFGEVDPAGRCERCGGNLVAVVEVPRVPEARNVTIVLGNIGRALKALDGGDEAGARRILDGTLRDAERVGVADTERRDPEAASIDELMARFGSLGPVTWPG